MRGIDLHSLVRMGACTLSLFAALTFLLTNTTFAQGSPVATRGVITPTLSITDVPLPPLVIPPPKIGPAVANTAPPLFSASTPPAYHLVRPGDTLVALALEYEVDFVELMEVNNIRNPDILSAGARLRIPGGVGGEEFWADDATPATDGFAIASRGTITERMTLRSQTTAADSPYHQTTWLTFYGRPNVPIMGILGEHDLDELTRLLRDQARAYDQANGPALSVTPAYHLVYGMATRAPGDGSHLAYLSEEETLTYIERAQAEGFGVILDIQIGALTPVSATAVAFPFLQYENVHLAIDPEFALVHPRQTWPGNPIGYVTGEQVNEVQAAMQAYMVENGITGRRILLVHQFLDSMIVNKEGIDPGFDGVELTISVDGWGPPYGKISKYNHFVNRATSFAAFKLFYRWDEPLLSEREALGEDGYAGTHFIETTPNLIIYQ
jgi:LysM repeat protein